MYVLCRCSQCSIRHWWWVPIVAPMLGGAIAGFVYWLFIEAHHTMELEDKQPTSEDGSKKESAIAASNSQMETAA